MKQSKKFLLLIILLTGSFFCVSNTQPRFTYAHVTGFIAGNGQEVAFPTETEDKAKLVYAYLNKTQNFNTAFIRDPEQVRNAHVKSKGVSVFELKTRDNVRIQCTFFDRNSDKIAFIGSGFTNPRELMSPFVDLVSDCDVVLFDFRGHGYRKFDLLDPSTWGLNIAQLILGINSRETGLGQDEEKDVYGIVSAFKERKQYKQVFAVGVCYGATMFLKAQALYAETHPKINPTDPEPQLFDRMILDGAWPKLSFVIEKMKKDPALIGNPQKGGMQDSLLTHPAVTAIGTAFAKYICKLPIDNGFDLTQHLHKIVNTPILLLHGKDDLLVERDAFETLYNCLANTPKYAVYTSNAHVRNHLKQKELYKLLIDKFLTQSPADFEKLMLDPVALEAHLVADFAKSVQTTVKSSNQ